MSYLIVSPAYAPYSGVGSNRMMSFTQYLVEQGYEVIVLRNSPETWPEDSLKSTPPSGVIVRDVLVKGHFDDCAELYYEAITKVYDDYHIDCAVYSCNPYYTIVAAAKLKLRNGTPFIIDFRDLWINDETFTRSVLKRIKKIIIRHRFKFKEWKCISKADHVVTVTPRELDALKKQYPKYSDKMSVIYNGYDEKRLSDTLDNEENDKIDTILKLLDDCYSIGFFGKFGYYDYEYMVELLNAVKEVNKKGICLKIVHIGDLDSKSEKAMADVDFPNELYIRTGYLDYKTGVELLKHFTINCLIVHYKRGLGTKLFDYIYVDKPVVYFAPPDSSIADVLNTCAHSYRCENHEDAQKAIQEVIQNKINTLDCAEKEKYSRTIQNAQYEKLLKIIGGK